MKEKVISDLFSEANTTKITEEAEHKQRREVEETGEDRGEKQQEQEKEYTLAKNKKLVPYLLKDKISQRSVAYLPVIASFYKLLCESFAHKITEDEADTMSVPECIALLEKEGRQNNDLVILLRKVWADFKLAWTGIPLFIVLSHLSFTPFLLS
jgi:hypothetical protein